MMARRPGRRLVSRTRVGGLAVDVNPQGQVIKWEQVLTEQEFFNLAVGMSEAEVLHNTGGISNVHCPEVPDRAVQANDAVAMLKADHKVRAADSFVRDQSRRAASP